MDIFRREIILFSAKDSASQSSLKLCGQKERNADRNHEGRQEWSGNWKEPFSYLNRQSLKAIRSSGRYVACEWGKMVRLCHIPGRSPGTGSLSFSLCCVWCIWCAWCMCCVQCVLCALCAVCALCGVCAVLCVPTCISFCPGE